MVATVPDRADAHGAAVLTPMRKSAGSRERASIRQAGASAANGRSDRRAIAAACRHRAAVSNPAARSPCRDWPISTASMPAKSWRRSCRCSPWRARTKGSRCAGRCSRHVGAGHTAIIHTDQRRARRAVRPRDTGRTDPRELARSAGLLRHDDRARVLDDAGLRHVRRQFHDRQRHVPSPVEHQARCISARGVVMNTMRLNVLLGWIGLFLIGVIGGGVPHPRLGRAVVPRSRDSGTMATPLGTHEHVMASDLSPSPSIASGSIRPADSCTAAVRSDFVDAEGAVGARVSRRAAGPARSRRASCSTRSGRACSSPTAR